MPLRKYDDLPDYMKTEEIRRMFEEILTVDAEERPSAMDVGDALLAMLDRAWHDYRQLPPRLGQNIIDWALRHWDPNSIDTAAMLTAIIAHMADLGDVTKARAFLENRLKLTNNAAVKKEIEETLREMSPTPKFKTHEQPEAEGKA